MLRALRENLVSCWRILPPRVLASIIPGFCRVLENAELPDFNCRFLRRIYCNSATHVEFAGRTRVQFLMARSVRRGCPASGLHSPRKDVSLPDK